MIEEARTPLRLVQSSPSFTEGRLWAANLSGPYLNWSFATVPKKVSAEAQVMVQAWSKGEHRRYKGLVIYGPTGTGKTGLLVSAGHAMIRQGFGDPMRWLLTAPRSAEMLVERDTAIREGHRKRVAPVWYETWTQYERRLRRASRVGRDAGLGDEEPLDFVVMEEMAVQAQLLLLDGLDVGTFTDWKEGMMLDLVDRPTNGRLIAVTLLCSPAEAEERLGPRVADRLLDPSQYLVVQLNGGSLRHA
jgi:hypothetical protein